MGGVHGVGLMCVDRVRGWNSPLGHQPWQLIRYPSIFCHTQMQFESKRRHLNHKVSLLCVSWQLCLPRWFATCFFVFWIMEETQGHHPCLPISFGFFLSFIPFHRPVLFLSLLSRTAFSTLTCQSHVSEKFLIYMKSSHSFSFEYRYVMWGDMTHRCPSRTSIGWL